MHEPSIEEQLKVIEAALGRTEARNLPAVMPTASVPEDIRVRDKREGERESRELAIALLQKMEKRVADLEMEGMLHRQHQVIAEALHQEEREAIEVISDELAALKKRAARVEQWLQQMDHQPEVPREPYRLRFEPLTNKPQQALMMILLAISSLGLLLFVLLRGP
ncbi:MAG: hypothetical protein GTO55_10275 [Armatimonadetes bacterium]|nr:hypothetical protein [Armatimonadota bacterium]NIM24624.1 hypothetical protein [Armatimonadota bacterium]NIM68503.1 hypothetical protein [Armatimonadota bacterium]NIM76885.1 hypothetical protein [Armatimonadota bacterium]NIN06697.1 hypothetical protein [Armatimonadota bacterium]